MLIVKIFESDDLEGLEAQMQSELDALPPDFAWEDHDVLLQYDGKNTMSRQSYSAMLLIKPNKKNP